MRLNLFSAIFKFASWKLDANQIKANPELREKSVKFGVSAIIRSFVALALTCGIFLFAIFRDSNPVLFIIFGIAFGIALPLGGLINYVGALTNSILQMSINKKKIGWLSLVLCIICIAASVVIVYYALTSFGA